MAEQQALILDAMGVIYDAADDVYVPFLDEKILIAGTISTTIIQSTDVYVVTLARQGPGQVSDDKIEPFQQSNTIGANGLSQPLIRNPDTVAT